MTFSNVQVQVDQLPALDAVAFEPLNPRYARLVLAVASAWSAGALLVAAVLLFLILLPGGRTAPATAGIAWSALIPLLGGAAWLAYRGARVIGFALREHDVIVRSGIFWRRETVQPIRRIQHVEQHQGPLDRRFGLYTLKLFSAGTGHFTFRIPGLDEATAARIRRHVTVMPPGSGPASGVTGGGESPPGRTSFGLGELRSPGRSHEGVEGGRFREGLEGSRSPEARDG